MKLRDYPLKAKIEKYSNEIFAYPKVLVQKTDWTGPGLTLMLLLATLANTKLFKNPEK